MVLGSQKRQSVLFGRKWSWQWLLPDPKASSLELNSSSHAKPSSADPPLVHQFTGCRQRALGGVAFGGRRPSAIWSLRSYLSVPVALGLLAVTLWRQLARARARAGPHPAAAFQGLLLLSWWLSALSRGPRAWAAGGSPQSEGGGLALREPSSQVAGITPSPDPVGLQFSSVSQSCPTLWDRMDCSTPGRPIHHQLPDPVQTHVHWVSDAIQLSHPLLFPSPPTFSLSQHQGLQLLSTHGTRLLATTNALIKGVLLLCRAGPACSVGP